MNLRKSAGQQDQDQEKINSFSCERCRNHGLLAVLDLDHAQLCPRRRCQCSKCEQSNVSCDRLLRRRTLRYCVKCHNHGVWSLRGSHHCRYELCSCQFCVGPSRESLGDQIPNVGFHQYRRRLASLPSDTQGDRASSLAGQLRSRSMSRESLASSSSRRSDTKSIAGNQPRDDSESTATDSATARSRRAKSLAPSSTREGLVKGSPTLSRVADRKARSKSVAPDVSTKSRSVGRSRSRAPSPRPGTKSRARSVAARPLVPPNPNPSKGRSRAKSVAGSPARGKGIVQSSNKTERRRSKSVHASRAGTAPNRGRVRSVAPSPSPSRSRGRAKSVAPRGRVRREKSTSPSPLRDVVPSKSQKRKARAKSVPPKTVVQKPFSGNRSTKSRGEKSMTASGKRRRSPERRARSRSRSVSSVSSEGKRSWSSGFSSDTSVSSLDAHAPAPSPPICRTHSKSRENKRPLSQSTVRRSRQRSVSRSSSERSSSTSVCERKSRDRSEESPQRSKFRSFESHNTNKRRGSNTARRGKGNWVGSMSWNSSRVDSCERSDAPSCSWDRRKDSFSHQRERENVFEPKCKRRRRLSSSGSGRRRSRSPCCSSHTGRSRSSVSVSGTKRKSMSPSDASSSASSDRGRSRSPLRSKPYCASRSSRKLSPCSTHGGCRSRSRRDNKVRRNRELSGESDVHGVLGKASTKMANRINLKSESFVSSHLNSDSAESQPGRHKKDAEISAVPNVAEDDSLGRPSMELVLPAPVERDPELRGVMICVYCENHGVKVEFDPQHARACQFRGCVCDKCVDSFTMHIKLAHTSTLNPKLNAPQMRLSSSDTGNLETCQKNQDTAESADGSNSINAVAGSDKLVVEKDLQSPPLSVLFPPVFSNNTTPSKRDRHGKCQFPTAVQNELHDPPVLSSTLSACTSTAKSLGSGRGNLGTKEYTRCGESVPPFIASKDRHLELRHCECRCAQLCRPSSEPSFCLNNEVFRPCCHLASPNSSDRVPSTVEMPQSNSTLCANIDTNVNNFSPPDDGNNPEHPSNDNGTLAAKNSFERSRYDNGLPFCSCRGQSGGGRIIPMYSASGVTCAHREVCFNSNEQRELCCSKSSVESVVNNQRAQISTSFVEQSLTSTSHDAFGEVETVSSGRVVGSDRRHFACSGHKNGTCNLRLSSGHCPSFLGSDFMSKHTAISMRHECEIPIPPTCWSECAPYRSSFKAILDKRALECSEDPSHSLQSSSHLCSQPDGKQTNRHTSVSPDLSPPVLQRMVSPKRPEASHSEARREKSPAGEKKGLPDTSRNSTAPGSNDPDISPIKPAGEGSKACSDQPAGDADSEHPNSTPQPEVEPSKECSEIIAKNGAAEKSPTPINSIARNNSDDDTFFLVIDATHMLTVTLDDEHEKSNSCAVAAESQEREKVTLTLNFDVSGEKASSPEIANNDSNVEGEVQKLTSRNVTEVDPNGAGPSPGGDTRAASCTNTSTSGAAVSEGDNFLGFSDEEATAPPPSPQSLSPSSSPPPSSKLSKPSATPSRASEAGDEEEEEDLYDAELQAALAGMEDEENAATLDPPVPSAPPYTDLKSQSDMAQEKRDDPSPKKSDPSAPKRPLLRTNRPSSTSWWKEECYGFDDVEKNVRFCVKCRNHDLLVRTRGHKGCCPFEACTCELCTRRKQKEVENDLAVRRSGRAHNLFSPYQKAVSSRSPGPLSHITSNTRADGSMKYTSPVNASKQRRLLAAGGSWIGKSFIKKKSSASCTFLTSDANSYDEVIVKEEFSCAWCGMTFANFVELHDHIVSHAESCSYENPTRTDTGTHIKSQSETSVVPSNTPSHSQVINMPTSIVFVDIEWSNNSSQHKPELVISTTTSSHTYYCKNVAGPLKEKSSASNAEQYQEGAGTPSTPVFHVHQNNIDPQKQPTPILKMSSSSDSVNTHQGSGELELQLQQVSPVLMEHSYFSKEVSEVNESFKQRPLNHSERVGTSNSEAGVGCVECNKTCASPSDHIKHYVTHHSQERLFQCTACSAVYGTALRHKVHSATSHNPLCLCCPLCPERYSSRELLNVHLACDHRQRCHLFRCPLCCTTLSCPELLALHISTGHPGQCPYTCDCGADFASLLALRSHCKVHVMSLAKYHCSICFAWFPADELLRAHRLSVHNLERPYTCPLCADGFRTILELSSHVSSAHSSSYLYQCKRCKGKFRTPSEFLGHLMGSAHMVYPSKKMFQCRSCSFTSTDRIHVADHEQVKHMGILALDRVVEMFSLMNDSDLPN